MNPGESAGISTGRTFERPWYEHEAVCRRRFFDRPARISFRIYAGLQNAVSVEEDEPDSPGGRHPIVKLVDPWRGEVAEFDEEDERESEDEAGGREETSTPHPLDLGGGPGTPKILVVQRSGKLAADIDRVAGGLVPEPEVLRLNRPTDIVEVVDTEDPDVIILGQQEVNSAGLKSLAAIHRANPQIVIVLSENPGKAWTAAQMAASGASDFLPTNPTPARLRNKLVAALSTSERLRVQNVVVTERVVIQQTAPVEPTDGPGAGRACPGIFGGVRFGRQR